MKFKNVGSGSFEIASSLKGDPALLLEGIDQEAIYSFYSVKSKEIAVARDCSVEALEEQLQTFLATHQDEILQVRVVGVSQYQMRDFIGLLTKLEQGEDRFDLISADAAVLPERFIADPETGLLFGQ